MSKSNWSIPNLIARTAIAAALGITLLGGAAYADQTPAEKHEQEMSKGLDHSAARDAAGEGVRRDSDWRLARALKHADEMNQGKDHYAAWGPTRPSKK